ncbi:hypothetical protein [Cohnella terricola]|uniref:Uncharacterized protein n=1 Tax=Cohnella terricola TaxID=1289167 RepID=A0A559JT31_9BACL|nr:hypothetical protein [Cohnella terricola]TVY03036.1 hypothetical protein FPZ45_03860 [Cohnella terricola]
MKGLYRLVNIEFAKWLMFIAVLCAAAVILPQIAIQDRLKNYNEFTVNAPFEELYASSGGAMLFLVFLALICAYFLVTVYADYWGSKSVYTYLTLPVKREALYFSKVIVFAACLLLLLAAQLIGIRLGYAIYANKVASYGEGMFVVHNGYFLAMIRSEFFRLLLPLSFSRMLSTFALLAVTVTGFYYGALCERSRKFYGFAAIIAAAWIAISVIGYRMNEKLHYMEPKTLYVSSALLLVLSGFFIWHGLRIVRKGAVA